MKEDTPRPEFVRTQHPAAQWFPQASFGLFMHWGISSVAGIQPSWAMIKDYPAGGDPLYHPPEKYYALADEFDPQHYDPDQWLAAAANAGMTYAVLTSKHHDGYALWPSAHGDMSTRQYLDGRDLLAPYVEACRHNGLKVGFYYSPADWHFPGYRPDFDFNLRPTRLPPDPAIAEPFYAYVMGQIEELLTRYGQIDVLWFDGGGFPGIPDFHTMDVIERVRELQPGIVINNRWGLTGDFTTPECHFPEGRPQGWWEQCHIWQGGHGGWGYSYEPRYQPLTWVMQNLVKCRAWGGNFLCNVGPAPDGTMHPTYYSELAKLAQWMQHSKEAVIGAVPVPDPECADVPLTQAPAGSKPAWYAHLLAGADGRARIKGVPAPCCVELLRTGQPVVHSHHDDLLEISLESVQRDPLDDVVKIVWK